MSSTRAIAPRSPDAERWLRLLGALLIAFVLLSAAAAFAHDLSQANKTYVQSINGPAPVPFFYLGAKHMVTGIDHILFLVGVIFFLYRLREMCPTIPVAIITGMTDLDDTTCAEIRNLDAELWHKPIALADLQAVARHLVTRGSSLASAG